MFFAYLNENLDGKEVGIQWASQPENVHLLIVELKTAISIFALN